MRDKEKLGTRYTCFQCGQKFYDLNRPAPTCPECSTDQSEAPLRDIRSLLSSGRRAKRKAPEPEPVEEKETSEDEEEDDFDDDGDDDDDGDGDDDSKGFGEL